VIAWHFTEMPYPHLPPLDELPGTRVTLSNQLFDPKIGAALYNRYLDEYMIADELGFNIMLNEHHQSAGCIDVAAPLSAAILARQTKNARICILGNPIANRGEPVRIAEEMAMIDCISHGRLDVGFVRGVANEIYPGNTNPTQTSQRLWEGVDLVVRAWTSPEIFSFEGTFWTRRAVNIWPRPFQQPHPPVWITGSTDKENIRRVAAHGFTLATFLQPYATVREMFDAYRESYVGNGVPGCGGLAYMPLVFTGDSEAEAMRGAEELLWYMKAAKAEPQFRNPPGYASIDQNVKALQGSFASRAGAIRGAELPVLMEQGVLIAGTPDSVAQQIRRFYDLVGGFDHILMMQQAGSLDHERTVKSMTLFATEVYPQIKDLPGTPATFEPVAAG
jgi:alkanesulfonate monooxygenase SsuD/methylene tetrahydromethanopterin reductase-like flavin-dependent oxidoreductase (luciferase family)